MYGEKRQHEGFGLVMLKQKYALMTYSRDSQPAVRTGHLRGRLNPNKLDYSQLRLVPDVVHNILATFSECPRESFCMLNNLEAMQYFR